MVGKVGGCPAAGGVGGSLPAGPGGAGGSVAAEDPPPLQPQTFLSSLDRVRRLACGGAYGKSGEKCPVSHCGAPTTAGPTLPAPPHGADGVNSETRQVQGPAPSPRGPDGDPSRPHPSSGGPCCPPPPPAHPAPAAGVSGRPVAPAVSGRRGLPARGADPRVLLPRVSRRRTRCPGRVPCSPSWPVPSACCLRSFKPLLAMALGGFWAAQDSCSGAGSCGPQCRPKHGSGFQGAWRPAPCGG